MWFGIKNDNHFIRILSAEVNHTKDKKKQNGNKTQDLWHSEKN